ncbi:hypothetical protein PROFUN_14826 [Planoprotostelium fungivorum]|uniref:Uncharacterized protein n=1 Tax=Planoprotostelium fungivorum TaxID=1890364 RepID=A0A2P6MNH9_9EUKA|nr:hypothetical protein PROFUN_14826 [Planoprotostelium fungivorum]
MPFAWAAQYTQHINNALLYDSCELLRNNSHDLTVLLFHCAQHHNHANSGQKRHLTTTKAIVGNTYGGLYSTDALMFKNSGPNKVCHCGSGRKYKKCHVAADPL